MQLKGTRSRRVIPTIVLCPLAKVSSSDNVLEDESNDSPRHIVDGGGGRNETGSVEDDGHVDILVPPPVGVLLRHDPGENRSDRADEEEEEKAVVCLPFRELALRSHTK
jgi:hypothetical protein